MSLFKFILKFAPVVGIASFSGGFASSVLCEQLTPEQRIRQTGTTAVNFLENKIILRKVILELVQMKIDELKALKKHASGDDLKDLNDLLDEGTEILSGINKAIVDDKDIKLLIELGIKHDIKHLEELHNENLE